MNFVEIDPYFINLDQIAYVKYGEMPDPSDAALNIKVAIITYRGEPGGVANELRLKDQDAERLLHLLAKSTFEK